MACSVLCLAACTPQSTLRWRSILKTVAQAHLPQRHLISQNVANGSAKIENPHPAVSIFNFHYAAPPTAVEVNYDLNKVIGDNETGFRGTGDGVYRMEAWDFIIAGGGLFNHLDYSFVAGQEPDEQSRRKPEPRTLHSGAVSPSSLRS